MVHSYGVIVAGNINDVTVLCSHISFTISGRVNGLSAGQEVTLLNNGTDMLVINSNNEFTFPLTIASNASYDVSIATQPNKQICTVSDGTGSDVISNISSVRVNCSSFADSQH